MDEDPFPTVKLRAFLILVVSLCGVIGFTWQAWDMFSPARRPMLQGWDDSYYYFWLPSVVIDHDVDFTNQLSQSRTLDPGMRETALGEPRTATGLLTNKYPPGWAIGSLPFFLAAHFVSPAGATGFEPTYLVAVWLGQLAYAALGLWLAVCLLGRYFSKEIAAAAVLTAWLASPLLYYQTARLSMSHSQVFVLAVASFLVAKKISEGDERTRLWWLWGFCAALLVVTRNVCAVYLIAPAWLVAKRLRRVSDAVALLAGAAIPLAIQLFAWKALYGSWIAYSYGGERFDFAHLHLREILFSPRHGWFYWHPLMLVGLAAFGIWAWRRPEGRGWLLSLALVVVLNAAWPMWWLGSSFGHRGFEVATFFAMAGLAAALAWVRGRPWLSRICTTVIILAVAWNLLLGTLFLTQRIPREDPVSYLQMFRALVR